ncbi:MAG: ABC transporter substrate-binding protein [Desulfurispora sp.]|uniref:ABC transporter substrate-binding protein n=1 Tax=Desulfurispora sp. TaxID=3014275 RepID=UPI00404A1AB4
MQDSRQSRWGRAGVKRSRRWAAAGPVLLMAVLALVLLLAGCGSSGQPDGKGGPGEGQAAAKPDELVLAIGGEPDAGFDPTTGWGRYGSPLFQSTLLTRDNDLNIVKDLATDYQVSPDGLTWTVKIRNDARFSDGKPLTAADVAYTYATAAKSGSVVDLNVLAGVQALDEHTVQFKLKQAQSTFINLLITLGIVPKHAHGGDYAKNPVGSGPYKLVQWDKGQQLIVEPNPYYYGPKPAFKKVTFLFLSEDAAFAAAKAGQVDVAAVPHMFVKQTVPGMRLVAVQSVDNRGIMFPTVPSGQKTKDGRPVGNDVTADPAIRRAINLAVDRQTLVNTVLEGQGRPAYTVCDNLPWWNPQTELKDADVEGAKKVLAAAGWQDKDGDGVLEKGGLKARFTLVYPASDSTRQSLAMAVRDMIKPLGIDITVEGKSWDDIKQLMHANAVLFGWGSHDPLEMYNLFHSKNRGVEWFNPGFYSNPTVDKYLDQALQATDPAQANQYWQLAQWDGRTGLSALGDAPWAWLVNINHCYFVRENLDTGKNRIEPHGHGWPITANIVEWKRK